MTPKARRTALLALVTGLCLAAFVPAVASAAITHEFLPEPSKRLSEGVPGEGPAKEPVALPGLLTGVNSMTVDSGDLFVAEGQSEGRIDEFDAQTGAFVRQFPQVPGTRYLHQAVAVRDVTGEESQVFVAGDEASGVVAVFGVTGVLKSVWTGAAAPSKGFGCFECEGAGSVAVDNSTSLGDWAAGDVYVADPEHSVVDVFTPGVGGKEPASLAGELTAPEPGVPFTPVGVAVNQATGEVFVANGEGTASPQKIDVFKTGALAGTYEFVRELALQHGTEAIGDVTVDQGNGEIFLADTREGGSGVDEFLSTGEYAARLTKTPAGGFTSVPSVAVDPLAPHDVYVGDVRKAPEPAVIDVFGPDLVIADVLTEAPSALNPTSATLAGTVKLAKEGDATCKFMWGTSKQFGHEAACEPSQLSAETTAVHADLTKLLPDTTYYYRLQATNKNGTNEGQESEDQQFTTPGPGIGQEWAFNVSSTSATLDAVINPNKAPTAYHFEYDTSPYAPGEAPHGISTPIPDESIGSGTEPVQVVPRHLQHLTANTPYYYRVAAVSELNGKTEPFYGPSQTFTTQRTGTEFTLPDGRQYELVSPPDKHGAQIFGLEQGSLLQAAQSGDAISYPTNGPTEPGVQGYFESVQVISSRGPSGWSSQDVSLPHATATGATTGQLGEYRFFTEDLSSAIVQPFGDFTSLSPDVFPLDTGRTPYVRHDATCASSPGTCFEPLVTSAPGYADVKGTEFGGNEITSSLSAVEFVGASDDVSHIVVTSAVALTPTPTAGIAMYEWSALEPPANRLRVVSVLPENEGGAAVGGTLGEENRNAARNARGAISADGSRVFWTADNRHLYLRDLAKGEGETLKLDAPEQGCLAKGGCGEGLVYPRFQFANSDGTEVFFTDEQRLTPGSGAGGQQRDLYECVIVERAGEDACELHDLTPAVAGQSAGVQGLTLANEDDSDVYFVANGVLAAGATPGTCVLQSTVDTGLCNLYLRHHDAATRQWDAPVFIATLSGEDNPDWGGVEAHLAELTARVSPNGRYLAFMSDRSLTGYDNRDANSGHPDEEVYLYDAEDGRLACASCNPTGARPVGEEYGEGGIKKGELADGLAGGRRVWGARVWLAANVPAWTSFRIETARYQPRYLSNEGRLFFNSDDALVPQDINNNEDVYQFEPAGLGSCGEGSSSGSSTYVAGSGGCVSLISSGTAEGESAFLDASANGSDVFFLTGEKLVPQDTDSALDVYDAHVCTAQSPCTSQPVSPPPCTTADACRVAPTPQPGIFGDPSSATFSGRGNPAPPPPVVKPKTAEQIRIEKLNKALKSCRKKKNKHKRQACEKAARKTHAKKASAKRSSKASRAINDRRAR